MRPVHFSLLLGLCLPGAAQACMFGAHELGGFVAFDAAGGSWRLAGWLGRNDSTGTGLSGDSWAVVQHWSQDGVVDEVRPLDTAAIDTLMRGLPRVESQIGDAGTGMVAGVPDDSQLQALARGALRDRPLVDGLPVAPAEVGLLAGPTGESCLAGQAGLSSADGLRRVVTLLEYGPREALEPAYELKAWMHPGDEAVAADVSWGNASLWHGRGGTQSLVLPLTGECGPAGCVEDWWTGGGCVEFEGPPEPDRASEGAWLKVTRVASDDVLHVRSGPNSSALVRESLKPDARCIWAQGQREPREHDSARDKWLWLPGRGWAHRHYLTEDPGPCTLGGA